jgi:hypothetical protein
MTSDIARHYEEQTETNRGSTTRVRIRFGFWKPLLVALGLSPSRSYLDLGRDVVRIRMGCGFSAEIPRTSIRSVRRVGNPAWSIGVHGRGGRWLVNGARGPLVSIGIDPPVRAHTIAIPIRLCELQVSVDDPDALVAAVASERRLP